VIAADSHAFKTKLLDERMHDLGVPRVTSIAMDATDPETLASAIGTGVHAVLVDAPCSGLGTLRRHPEQRWRMRPDAVASLALLGSQLLEAASCLVDASGFVVYSTCTLTRAENCDVIEGFLASESGSEFRRDSVVEEVPPEWQRFVAEQGDFQSVPESDGPDGHYVVRLKHR
jgi:16S rRNA (cytosine967-C5)-methyltransferase